MAETTQRMAEQFLLTDTRPRWPKIEPPRTIEVPVPADAPLPVELPSFLFPTEFKVTAANKTGP